jgi:hypothetical protein
VKTHQPSESSNNIVNNRKNQMNNILNKDSVKDTLFDAIWDMSAEPLRTAIDVRQLMDKPQSEWPDIIRQHEEKDKLANKHLHVHQISVHLPEGKLCSTELYQVEITVSRCDPETQERAGESMRDFIRTHKNVS